MNYNKSLLNQMELIRKNVSSKVENKQKLTDLEFMFYIFFQEIAPILVDYKKQKEQD